MKRIGAGVLGMAMLIGPGLAASPAQAAYIVTLVQQGSNVVATGSGTIDLTGLSFIFTDNEAAAINPSDAFIVTGPVTVEPLDDYVGFVGPASFGSGSATSASSGSGDTVGIFGSPGLLFLPSGYLSGAALSDSATYDNQTFSSLGVTPGSYVWTWGSGADADSFTLDIGTAPLPEPSSLSLLALPLGFLMLLAGHYAGRRRAMALSLPS